MSEPATSSTGLWPGDDDRRPRRLEAYAPGLPRRRRLWFAFLGAPVAWALDLVVGYAIQATVCDTRGPGASVLGLRSATALPVLVSILAALVAAGAVVVAWRSWRLTGTGEENPEAEVSAAVGRSWFMSFAGMVSSVIFLLAIVLIGITELSLAPCWQF